MSYSLRFGGHSLSDLMTVSRCLRSTQKLGASDNHTRTQSWVLQITIRAHKVGCFRQPYMQTNLGVSDNHTCKISSHSYMSVEILLLVCESEVILCIILMAVCYKAGNWHKTGGTSTTEQRQSWGVLGHALGT